jgi:hypothetical protein
MMSWPSRSAFAITSIATIFPLAIVNVRTVTRRPRGVTRIAGRPLTNPLWASLAPVRERERLPRYLTDSAQPSGHPRSCRRGVGA